MQFAVEPPGKVHFLLVGELLIAENQYAVLVHPAADLPECRFVEGLAQGNRADFGDEAGSEWGKGKTHI